MTNSEQNARVPLLSRRVASGITDIRRHKHQSMVEIDFPSLTRVMYDRQWMPNIPLICRNLETTYFIQPVHLGKKNELLVSVSQTVDVIPEFYNVTFSTPLLLQMKVPAYWEKGIRLQYDLLNKDTGEVLLSNVRTSVKVDKQVGKVVPLTAQEMEHFNSTGSTYLPSSRIRRPVSPPGAFLYDIKPVASDYDNQGHVNQTVYIRYCQDAVYEAARWGALPSFPSKVDTAGRRTEHISMDINAELFVGDKLQIHVWQVDPCVVGFSFKKPGSERVLCAGTMKYAAWKSKL